MLSCGNRARSAFSTRYGFIFLPLQDHLQILLWYLVCWLFWMISDAVIPDTVLETYKAWTVFPAFHAYHVKPSQPRVPAGPAVGCRRANATLLVLKHKVFNRSFTPLSSRDTSRTMHVSARVPVNGVGQEDNFSRFAQHCFACRASGKQLNAKSPIAVYCSIGRRPFCAGLRPSLASLFVPGS